MQTAQVGEREVAQDVRDIYEHAVGLLRRSLEAQSEPDLEVFEIFCGLERKKALLQLFRGKPKVFHYRYLGLELFEVVLGSPALSSFWVFPKRGFCTCGNAEKCAHVHFVDLWVQCGQKVQPGPENEDSLTVELYNQMLQ